jgi:hypothetical protein
VTKYELAVFLAEAPLVRWREVDVVDAAVGEMQPWDLERDLREIDTE